MFELPLAATLSDQDNKLLFGYQAPIRPATSNGLRTAPAIGIAMWQSAVAAIKSLMDRVGGRSPFPSPHTTVRTGPYTAVQESRDRTGI